MKFHHAHYALHFLSRLIHQSYVPFAPANRTQSQSADGESVPLALCHQTIFSWFMFYIFIIGKEPKRLNGLQQTNKQTGGGSLLFAV